MKEKATYLKMMRGYLGFLTGRGKSISTIASYKGDLQLFQGFLDDKKKNFFALQAKDFEAYLYWLEKKGLKMNTRRRKIITAKSLVKYAVSRKKMQDLGKVQFVKAPDRLERLPWIPRKEDWEKIYSSMDERTALGLRNKIVVLLLAETGLALASLCSLRWEQLKVDGIHVEGKKPRVVKLSEESQKMLDSWRLQVKGKHLFPGFNRYGIASEKMTPRGVELFFKTLAKRTGYKRLKPKTLRHYAVTQWLQQNLSDKEITERLAVHPSYGLDAYKKFLS